MNTVAPSSPPASSRRVRSLAVSTLLLVLCAPWGLIRLWRRGARPWVLAPYALVGLPAFLVLYGFFGLLAFSACLPALDMSVSEHAPRTVRFAAGNYQSTFLETSRDTGGIRELIRVEIQPHGGN